MILLSFFTGVNYNLENILVGIHAAKDKRYALGCTVPYIQYFVMMYASSYSALFKDYPAYFLVLNGFYLTWITAIFNLCSTSNSKFNWVFLEPVVYLSMVYYEYTGVVKPQAAGFLYSGFFLYIMIRYLLFLNNIVNQITTFMGLRFL